MQCWVAESVLQSLSLDVCTLRMYLNKLEFVLSWQMISEISIEFPSDVYLEEENDEDGRDGRYPSERFELVLEADS